MTHAPVRRVFGVALSPLSRAQVVEALLTPVAPGAGARLLATLNLDHVVQLQRRADFRAAYARAALVTADGAPVYAWARVRGGAPPERAPGADLLADLMGAWAPGLHRPFFVVSRPAVGEALAARLYARGFAADAVGWACPPFGFERDAGETARLLAAVRAHAPTHLIMGVGAPKSEVWVDAHRAELGDLVGVRLRARRATSSPAPPPARRRWMRARGAGVAVAPRFGPPPPRPPLPVGQLGGAAGAGARRGGPVLKAGDSFGSVESVKTVSDVYAPVGGEVIEVNPALAGPVGARERGSLRQGLHGQDPRRERG